jgi:zinc/manganese transport system substrate-binding protein
MKLSVWLGIGLMLLTPQALAETSRPEIVVTFSIAGDITRVVGGEDISMTVLSGAESDTHVFEPGPADVKTVASADLVIANGLGFESWLNRLVDAAGYAGPVLKLAEGIEALPFEEDQHDHSGHDHAGHDHGELDPHAWQDPRNGAAYARAIATALGGIDPPRAGAYRERAESYAAKLDETYAALKAKFDTLPDAQRGIVTAHSAFGYFGRAYGLRVTAIAGLSTRSEPSAGEVAHVIGHVREGGAVAIFVENIADARLAEQVASEGGLVIGGRLYSDALSAPGGDAPDYITLLKVNAGRVYEALSAARQTAQ